MAAPVRLSVPARIVVVAPPAGVAFALQRGRQELSGVAKSSGTDLQLDFTFFVARGADGVLRFSGDFVQGPSGGKFVYVTSGARAGQVGSPWTRRAKVGLQTLSWATVEQVTQESGSTLQARIAGLSRDGGPACATVPLLDEGWTVIRRAKSASGRTRG
jgi:hypothetical protein